MFMLGHIKAAYAISLRRFSKVSLTLVQTFFLYYMTFLGNASITTNTQFGAHASPKTSPPLALLGSLSNNISDTKDQARRKIDLYFTFEFHNHLELFSIPNSLKPFSN